jgi:hypothetical protein
MERLLLRKSSWVLGISANPSKWSRVYSLVIFLLITLSSLHVLYKSGKQEYARFLKGK